MTQRWDLGRAQRMVGRATTILEIGANDGTDTAALLDAFPDAAVHCFEPEPTAIDDWLRRITSPRAQLHRFAVAQSAGVATFHRSGGRPPVPDFPEGRVWNESGSLRRPTGHLEQWPWVEFDETIEVATIDLDSWAAAHGVDHVDVIWADVQGAEGDLVRGARQTLERTRYLYVETSEVEYYDGQVSTTELLCMLPGWKVVERFPHDILLRNAALTRPDWWPDWLTRRRR